MSYFQATCPRCQKVFNVPPEHGAVWRFCPYCNEVNPEALIRRDAGPSWQMGLGVLLFLAGFLGGTLGTFFCFLGVAFSRREQFLTAVWAAGSVALFASGAWFMKTANKPRSGTVWGGIFLMILTIGLCGWVFVIGTCSVPSR
jgi:hypothetical protein